MTNNSKKRKFLVTSLTATMVAAAVAPVAGFAAEANSFPDVPADHNYAGAITDMAKAGVIAGLPNGNFDLGGTMTRAQAAQMVAGLLELKTGAEANATDFEDVKGDVWYTGAVNSLVAEGIVAGKTAELFAPDADITRGELAQLLVMAYGLEDVKVDNVVLPFTDVAEDAWFTPAIKILYSEGLIDGQTSTKFGPKDNMKRGDFAWLAANVDYAHGDKLPKPVVANEVESVSAINATQVEVKFNTKVDPSTVFAAGTSGTLKSGLVTFNDLDPNTAGTNDVTGNSSTGVLSTDGKTLTITADTGKVFEGRYDVKISGVKDVDGNNVEVYDKKVLDLGKDTTLPTITEVEKLNASTIKVHFSEPLSDEGTWTFKDANGDPVVVTGASSHAAGESSVTLTIAGAVLAGTEITATVIGAKDQANNLISPNPTTFKFTKGAKDGVKPEVSSVTALGLDKFEIKFSEELSTLDITNIQIAGTPIVDFAINSTDGGVLKQDKDDKTKYTVELNGTSILTAGLHKIELAAAATTDLSGEDLKVFSQIVEFKADLVAPTFVSSEIVVDANKDEKLVLTFDKEVTQPAVFTTIVAKELNKNSVTTTDALDAGQLTVNPDNKKQLEVVLNTVNFDGAALNKDATYTVNFPDAYVAGVNGVDVEAFNVSFTRGEDEVVPTSDKPEIASGDIVVVNTNTITVEFDKEVVGSTATNVANYSIPGVVIETATLAAVSGGTQTVTLTLKKDSNTLTGDRAITINNVQAKNGAVMDTHTESISLFENVVPTVESAKFTGVTGGEVNEITVTFSEAVSVAQDAFEFFVGDATVAKPTTNTAIASGGTEVNQVVLTVTTPLTTEDIAKGITVKLVDGKVVADVNANPLEFTSIKATY